jgi:hypothetical protein
VKRQKRRCLEASQRQFLRSRSASAIDFDDGQREKCVELWNRFLSICPARRIVCIGINTASQFLKHMNADKVRWFSRRTRHPRANAVLAMATIANRRYRIAAVPHLSRFNVANDLHLAHAIKKHFR